MPLRRTVEFDKPKSMSRKIVILELTPNDGIISFDSSLDKKTYLFQDWDEPYHSRINIGDEFFIINRCLDVPGITMHGTVASEVHRYISPRSYSAPLRVVLTDYLDINPEKYRLLTVDVLQTAMPCISWDLGFPGWLVTGPYIKKLRKMWKEYLEMNDDFVQSESDDL